MKAERYVKMGALLLLAGTAAFSGAVVLQSSAKILTHFVFELSQNLYFVGVVLTYVLWAAILKLRETRTRLIQLVLSLGIYFSLLAANYAIRNLYPQLGFVVAPLAQIVGTFLPLAWAYAFWRIPEEARLAPSRLAVIPR
jgi:glucan phosphoethanolaminetransferase (alkaline phosphatase superfamily)